jgi:hypothetical protein
LLVYIHIVLLHLFIYANLTSFEYVSLAYREQQVLQR